VSEHENQNEISRRRMLKRIGAGAAVAWSAPILTSIRTPAFAQHYVCGDRCADILCFSEEDFACNDAGTCICTRTTEDTCFCGDGNCPCDAYPPCSSSADCPSGQACGLLCCTGQLACLPPCGACGGQAPKGARRGGDR
jgi:hypothetical protein